MAIAEQSRVSRLSGRVFRRRSAATTEITSQLPPLETARLIVANPGFVFEDAHAFCDAVLDEIGRKDNNILHQTHETAVSNPETGEHITFVRNLDGEGYQGSKMLFHKNGIEERLDVQTGSNTEGEGEAIISISGHVPEFYISLPSYLLGRDARNTIGDQTELKTFLSPADVQTSLRIVLDFVTTHHHK